ncbi:MAG: hypothetical protein LBG08_04135 [Spirochaetaceae bacterium]|jgi:hypothetical protein|nr:hypothetical protein [Spirochaetaceae bacterium]
MYSAFIELVPKPERVLDMFLENPVKGPFFTRIEEAVPKTTVLEQPLLVNIAHKNKKNKGF